MNFYITSLYFAIPIFVFLILFESIMAKRKGIKINRSTDMISSLSSGMTNIIRDAIKFSIVIISYSWIVDRFTIIKLEPLWLSIIIAFIVEDFSGYWMHRLNHRVNILWNRHVIHHSSEEFNLSCALRQSISDTIRFSAIFMFPAAFLGIPTAIFAILSPLHLLLQFWYHTQVIDKLGFLEKILVTPSHHRVHHAINPEYIDKNYSQIFIVWDKIFGTFQSELKNIKPVYGVLKPFNTWNPVIINFNHLWHLVRDAWRTKSWFDKLRIWFMPTGWRPKDMEEKFPVTVINNVDYQEKYDTKNSSQVIIWSWMQLGFTGVMIFHFFTVITNTTMIISYLYAIILILHVFSFTSTMDQRFIGIIGEGIKILLVVLIIYLQDYSWFGLGDHYLYALIFYFVTSFLITSYFLFDSKTAIISWED